MLGPSKTQQEKIKSTTKTKLSAFSGDSSTLESNTLETLVAGACEANKPPTRKMQDSSENYNMEGRLQRAIREKF